MSRNKVEEITYEQMLFVENYMSNGGDKRNAMLGVTNEIGTDDARIIRNADKRAQRWWALPQVQDYLNQCYQNTSESIMAKFDVVLNEMVKLVISSDSDTAKAMAGGKVLPLLDKYREKILTTKEEEKEANDTSTVLADLILNPAPSRRNMNN